MTAILELKNIYKSYEDREVLKGISLSVEKGEVLVLIGPSGCGKSTLLRVINGLEPIQDGQIFLNDVPIDKHDAKQLRQKIGMVFQSYDLFPHLTILENIILAPTKVQKRPKNEVISEAEELLKRVGLLDKKNDYPRQLSGGQKQRVAIIRALCMRPEIMLFDEVTAALDPEMVREVLNVILELANQGMTMLIVTHEMAFARAIADKVVFLDQGHIIEEGPPKIMFEQPKTQRVQDFLASFTYNDKHHI